MLTKVQVKFQAGSQSLSVAFCSYKYLEEVDLNVHVVTLYIFVVGINTPQNVAVNNKILCDQTLRFTQLYKNWSKTIFLIFLCVCMKDQISILMVKTYMINESTIRNISFCTLLVELCIILKQKH